MAESLLYDSYLADALDDFTDSLLLTQSLSQQLNDPDRTALVDGIHDLKLGLYHNAQLLEGNALWGFGLFGCVA